MTDTSTPNPNLPSRTQIRDDLETVLVTQTASGSATVSADDYWSIDRILQVARAYGRFGLVSGREHGEALERVRRAEERGIDLAKTVAKARRKNKKLKDRVKTLTESNSANIGHTNDRMRERDALLEHNAQLVRERGDAYDTLQKIQRALDTGRPVGVRIMDIRRILATESIAEQLQVPKNVIENPTPDDVREPTTEEARPGRHRAVDPDGSRTLCTCDSPTDHHWAAGSYFKRPGHEVKPDYVVGEYKPDPEFENQWTGAANESVSTPTRAIEALHRGDVIRYRDRDRTVLCVHDTGNDEIQVCLGGSRPYFLQKERGTLVEVVRFGARPATEGAGILHIPEELAPEVSSEDSAKTTDAIAEALVDAMKEPMPYIEKPVAVSAGGWCAPSDQLYSFLPEVKVSRGGISFTSPPKRKSTRKELRAMVDRQQDALNAERKANRKLRRQIRRLRKFVEGA